MLEGGRTDTMGGQDGVLEPSGFMKRFCPLYIVRQICTHQLLNPCNADQEYTWLAP
jgi:hypothetical protein